MCKCSPKWLNFLVRFRQSGTSFWNRARFPKPRNPGTMCSLTVTRVSSDTALTPKSNSYSAVRPEVTQKSKSYSALGSGLIFNLKIDVSPSSGGVERSTGTWTIQKYYLLTARISFRAPEQLQNALGQKLLNFCIIFLWEYTNFRNLLCTPTNQLNTNQSTNNNWQLLSHLVQCHPVSCPSACSPHFSEWFPGVHACKTYI